MATLISSGVLDNVPGATGTSQGGHLVYATNSARWWFFTWAGKLDSGTFSSGSTSQGTDNTKSWSANQFLGRTCIITGGSGSGQSFIIGSNTATSLPVIDDGGAATLGTAIDNTSVYEIIESDKVHAYVSSSSDLTTATWSEATGSPTPTIQTASNNTGYGILVPGGSNNVGGAGQYPTDGRLLQVGYANVSGTDVFLLSVQMDSHYFQITLRGRLTATTTIAWDGVISGTTNNWNDTATGMDCVPQFPQGSTVGYSSTGRWWTMGDQNSRIACGYAANSADPGTANFNENWQSNQGASAPSSFDTGAGDTCQSALMPLASGFMLAVYCAGNTASPAGSGQATQTGLRYAESASATQWPTTSTGAAVPNLSAATNDPNDWGIVARTNTDIHVVRRNAATTLEQVRYSGHGGSWGSKVTLPSTGLTGQLAGSGVALVSDNTNVWAFVIDTDANHSVRYIKWNGTSWDASWSTLSTGTEVKNFITATYNSTNNQIGVAWTANSASPFAVNYAVLSFASAVTSGAYVPQQTPFNRIGPGPKQIQDIRTADAPVSLTVDLKTRFIVRANPGALVLPPSFKPFGPHRSFVQATRTYNAPNVSNADLSTRFVINTQEGATQLFTQANVHPGLQGPSVASLVSFTQDIRTVDAPSQAYADISTRFRIVAPPGSLILPSTFIPGLPGPKFIQDTRTLDSPTSVTLDLKTRFIVNALPGAFLPPNTFHPGASPGGFFQFLQDTRTADASVSNTVDVKTRFTVVTQPGATQLLTNPIRPGLQGPGSADQVSFINDIRTADAPSSNTVDVKTRFIVTATVVGQIMGSQLPTVVRPGIQGPVGWSAFYQDTRTANAPNQTFVDVKTRFVINARPGALLDRGTYHPGQSPGGYSQFLQDVRSNVQSRALTVDARTRFVVQALPGAQLDKGTYHPGASPGGYFQFLQDVRTVDSPVSYVTDLKTRFQVNFNVSMGSAILGVTLPGNYPKSDPSFRLPVKAFDSPVSLFADLKTRFVVTSTALTGAMSSNLFVGVLGRSDSQLGNMQLGIWRTFYTGALESEAATLTNSLQHGERFLILQSRPFNIQLQSRWPGETGGTIYGEAIYGNGVYGGAPANTVQVAPRTFVVLVQSMKQGD